MEAERRRRSRRAVTEDQDVSVLVQRVGGESVEIDATLIDASDWGVALETSTPLVVGSKVSLWGASMPGAADRASARQANVIHCRTVGDRQFRAGCSFADAPQAEQQSEQKGDLTEPDLYEVLQVNPSADQDTIHRVYRILAQRYHPDNPETGDNASFQAVLNAYQTLNDPAKRASYDVRHQASKRLRWSIFQKPSDAEGVEIHRRMRAGILCALYELRAKDIDSTGLTIRELEQLLGCPREHLEFPVWYLRRRGLVSSEANGRLEITIDGCDAAEEFQLQGVGPTEPKMKELPAPLEAVGS